MEDKRYIISIKRIARSRVPSDWVEKLQNLEGVEIVGSGPIRVQVRAESGKIEQLRNFLGDDFHIEPVIVHKPLSNSDSK